MFTQENYKSITPEQLLELTPHQLVEKISDWTGIFDLYNFLNPLDQAEKALEGNIEAIRHLDALENALWYVIDTRLGRPYSGSYVPASVG